MNIKKYLQLSDAKLSELENKYNYLPKDYELENISLSLDRQCLRETLLIAKQRRQHKQTRKNELLLKHKRMAALRCLFIKPE